MRWNCDSTGRNVMFTYILKESWWKWGKKGQAILKIIWTLAVCNPVSKRTRIIPGLIKKGISNRNSVWLWLGEWQNDLINQWKNLLAFVTVPINGNFKIDVGCFSERSSSTIATVLQAEIHSRKSNGMYYGGQSRLLQLSFLTLKCIIPWSYSDKYLSHL